MQIQNEKLEQKTLALVTSKIFVHLLNNNIILSNMMQVTNLLSKLMREVSPGGDITGRGAWRYDSHYWQRNPQHDTPSPAFSPQQESEKLWTIFSHANQRYFEWDPLNCEESGQFSESVAKAQKSRKTAKNSHFSVFFVFLAPKCENSTWFRDKTLKPLPTPPLFIAFYEQNFPNFGKNYQLFSGLFGAANEKKLALFLQNTPRRMIPQISLIQIGFYNTKYCSCCVQVR